MINTYFQNKKKMMTSTTKEVSGYPCIINNSKGGDLKDYKIYGNSVQRMLPDEYQEVEYLESTGTQYIDTGVYGTEQGSYEIKFNTLGINEGRYPQYLAGDRASGAGKLYADSSVASYPIFFQSTGNNILLFNTDNVEHTISANEQGIFLDNVFKIKQELICSWGTLSYWVFNSHSEPYLFAKMRLYYLKMYSDGIIVRDFIPCYRKLDNKPGMYDLVNDVFYINEGTGEFLVGNAVNSMIIKNLGLKIGSSLLPEEYQQTEYIKFKGKQYIDTGFIPNNLSRISLDFTIDSTMKQYYPILGTRSSTNTNCIAMWTTTAVTDNIVSIRADYNTSSTQHVYSGLNITNKILLDYNKNVCSVNGNSYTFTETSFNCESNLLLGSSNNNNVADTRRLVGNIYSCKIYDNGTLIREYIPCYRKSDNVVGLYDLINNNFVLNSGTESFEVGPNDDSTVTGRKNLFNKAFANYTDAGVPINVKDNTTYIISGSKFGKVCIYGIRATNIETGVDTEIAYCRNLVESKTFTTNLSVYRDYIVRLYYADTQEIIDTIQVEEGSVPTEYEPYDGYKITVNVGNNESVMKTNIYLSEPLRKVGNYADYTDFSNQKVIRNIGNIASYNGETISTNYISSTGKLTTGANVIYQLDTAIEEVAKIPSLQTHSGTNIIMAYGDISASNIWCKY